MGREPNRKRGRPQKFGRAAQSVSLTLPPDIIDWLSAIDEDMGWQAGLRFESRSIIVARGMREQRKGPS